MTAFEIEMLIAEYGDISLSEVRTKILGGRKYKCPKCKGVGKVTVKYNAHPQGLSDSGLNEDFRYKAIGCYLCGGYGYTFIKLEPNMAQQGWT